MIRCLMSIASVAIFLSACTAEEPLPVLYPVPSAELVRSDGTRMNLDTLHGKVVVYDFIFTHCAASCPMMTRNMHQLVESMEAGAPVRFVSISVDPRRDTPEVLRRYARAAGEDPKWMFLTGAPAVIADLSRNGFKLAADTDIQPGAEALLHNTKFVLADRKGDIRGYYEAASAEDRAQLRKDLESLMRGGE